MLFQKLLYIGRGNHRYVITDVCLTSLRMLRGFGNERCVLARDAESQSLLADVGEHPVAQQLNQPVKHHCLPAIMFV